MTETFPKSWLCPKCGSGKRVTVEAYRGGAIPSMTSIRQYFVRMTGQNELVQRGLAMYYDICWDCGTEYCFKADMVKGLLSVPQVGSRGKN